MGNEQNQPIFSAIELLLNCCSLLSVEANARTHRAGQVNLADKSTFGCCRTGLDYCIHQGSEILIELLLSKAHFTDGYMHTCLFVDTVLYFTGFGLFDSLGNVNG